jgi:tetratricopeptide (TPR) repeat protein
MKKAILVSITTFFSSLLFAQSVEEAKNHLYYGRNHTAAEVLNSVVKANPADAQAWYWLSVAQAEREKPAELRGAIAAAPSSLAGDPWFGVAYGSLLLQEGKTDSAAHLFGRALNETREKDADILIAIARAHVEAPQGNATYAIELLDKAAKRAKRNPELDMVKGDAYRKLQKGSEAFQAYREALGKDEKYVPALFALGKIFTTQKNKDLYLEYFNKALAIDPKYAPALYEMYLHYYYTDVNQAKEYFNQYVANTEKDIRNEYLYTDLIYLARQYDQAIQRAQQLLQAGGDKEPRLYKLIAYSYQGLKDTARAMDYMGQYFAKAPDSVHVVMDYQTMGELYASQPGMGDSATRYFEKAVALQTDTAARYNLYKKLAGTFGEKKDYHNQAIWMGKYYEGNDKATNLDLFNWGLTHFRAGEYAQSDSVFAKYAEKYPEQAFGHYWRARSNGVMDKDMAQGLAVPHYQKVIEIAGKDIADANNRKWLVEAYAYLAAYETNTQKDYVEAIDYFEKLLTIDPENADAKKYIKVLEKNLGKESSATTEG